MKILLSLFFSLILTTIGLSQSDPAKPAITIGNVTVTDNNSIVRDLTLKTSTLLSKNFFVTENAALALAVVATPGKAYTINGMDSYTTSDVQVDYTIMLEGRESQTKTITVKCKSNRKKDLYRKIGTTILRDKKNREAVISFVEEYLTGHLSNCSAVTAIVDRQTNENEPARAYASLAYYDLAGGCPDIAQAKEDKILDAIAAKNCKSLVQEAEILANGATINQLTRATNKLLLIGPDTPCQPDIIRISELISSNAKALDTPSSTNINVKLEQSQSQDRAAWRQYYRKYYYGRN